ncbi:hypothetical protein Vadar_012527 [Vaccinium darrowii]|uniref:Uncharacterized protein n=1 Tax=Vaccinium darrowii TaxID=229202 RepID=A0ACB7XH40_9ERIC|nr:hypothetical protein Vadar_012527 [Vaccinium darrowii]
MSKEGLFTLFVDNLPEFVSLPWFKKLFNNYGVVKDAFIPEKRSKISGRKFGFVWYNCSISAEVAIARANGLWCEDKKLFVKYASFNQNDYRKSPSVRVGFHKNAGVGAYYHKDQDTERASHGENNIKEATGHHVSTFNSVTCFKSYAQILKGDHSGKMEKAFENLTTLTIPPTGSEWLSRSVVANLNKIIAIEELYKAFSMENLARKVLIATEKQDLIDDWIQLDVHGVLYKVRIQEVLNPDGFKVDSGILQEEQVLFAEKSVAEPIDSFQSRVADTYEALPNLMGSLGCSESRIGDSLGLVPLRETLGIGSDASQSKALDLQTVGADLSKPVSEEATNSVDDMTKSKEEGQILWKMWQIQLSFRMMMMNLQP